MKKILRIVFALSMGVIGGVLLAQTESDFSGWMKEVAATKGKLTAAVTAKDAAATTASAKILENDFKQVGAFFTKKGIADGAEKAGAAQAAAAATAKAAAAGNFDEATVESAKVAGSCGGCHGAHKGKDKGPEGFFLIH
ncbi:MAG: hypothetical protein ABI824_05670 [Acidobacteriota bacterium]